MAPDAMIRTIQPNGLYAIAYLYGTSRRPAVRAKDWHQKIIGTVPASFT